MQPLQICIGPTIRIGRESWCLLYAGFLQKVLVFHLIGLLFHLLKGWKYVMVFNFQGGTWSILGCFGGNSPSRLAAISQGCRHFLYNIVQYSDRKCSVVHSLTVKYSVI